MPKERVKVWRWRRKLNNTYIPVPGSSDVSCGLPAGNWHIKKLSGACGWRLEDDGWPVKIGEGIGACLGERGDGEDGTGRCHVTGLYVCLTSWILCETRSTHQV